MKSRFPLASFCIAVLLGCAWGQTQNYEINGQSSSSSNQQNNKSGNTSQNESGFGWGSSIETVRQARATQDALKRNDYAAAMSFAERAAKSAPQNAELWFLYGYAARLNEKYQISVDAFNHGLQIQPNSIHGLAGLAQTYAKMGRDAEAEQLLQRVVEANPKDANSLQLAGELMLNADPNKALDLLQRADAVQASAHTDLLIAHAYDRLGQHDESTRYLNRAKARAPHDPEVLRAVADQFRDNGQYDQAIATLQSLHSKSLDVESDLAYTYQLAGKQQEAAALYSRLAKSAKGNINLDLSAAQAWMNLNQTEKARPFLDDARQIDGNNYRLHSILGAVAENEDRLADAASEYNMALANMPPRPPEGPLFTIEVRLSLYELAVRQNDDANAKQHLSAAAAQLAQVNVSQSERPEMLRLRAAIETAQGNLDAADKDLKEALALAPTNVNSLLNYGTLQWKLGQKDAARATFEKILGIDNRNRTALSSLGYLARDRGDNKLAETYFTRALNAHPTDYAPYLALADLYTAERNYHAAESRYEEAYQRSQGSPAIIAGGANAALGARDLDLATRWLDRAKDGMNDNPQVMRERERYLTLNGDYAESAKVGSRVLEKLPNDHEGVIYLAYDLYYLGRYQDAMALVDKYDAQFGNEKDLALISGYIHVHNGQSREAFEDFTRALKRDPKMATGYVNRGFVENDLKEADRASQDFRTALKMQPNYGEAHLGLAFADLQLHRPKPALQQLDIAEKLLGKSHTWHLARAEAYRQEQDFAHAEPEYRIALQETPNDLPTQLVYADVLFRMRRFEQSIAALETAQKLAPTDPRIYALKAQVHAKEGDREKAMQDIQMAEQYGRDQVDILMATGDALLSMGDRDAAMQRFARALDAPKGDRVGVRLAVAQVLMRQGHFDEARRQIAIGFAEARTDRSEVTGEDILEAANIFLAMHDFDLAETYFDKAKLAGANPRTVEIGLANTYLAEGETRKAEMALNSLGPADDYRDDYDYMMASANLYRQRQDSLHALAAFAQASTIAGQEDRGTAETAQYELAGEEGRQITPQVSVFPEGSFAPQLEDINVYQLDARILKVTNPALLPPPRHSFQNLAISHYRLHLGNLPTITGFAGESMTFGRLLFPSNNVVQDRNTYDTYINGGITPILHLGSNSIAFNGGLQFTIRRDTISPVAMSQNLFRQFLYISTSSLYNWVQINASGTRETGPFIDQDLHSRDLAGSVEFSVGRPWGRTSLLAGYTARDLLIRPLVEEYFSTSSYVGLQHKFGSRLTAAILAEDLRSWRVQTVQFAIAQAFLPGARFELRANPRWSLQGSFLLSRGMGFHQYDNAQSELLVSYIRPVSGRLKDGTGEIPVAYPFRFSLGVQQQTFYNFNGTAKTTLLPVVHFTLF
ncbi:MAG TPA: tetratricopeptide repeat protein [Candidatus Sulfotelmatobacter sp.]|nr:tetratricopeptide repeat protein [Candidatus Sulfotelmatobacter sp.]